MERLFRLSQFLKQLESNTNDLLSTLEHGEYSERFDVDITIFGYKLTIDLNADTYYRLLDFALEEAKEDIDTYLEDIKPLALRNFAVIFKSSTGHVIVNPFMDEDFKRTVHPLEYYGKYFLMSDWFDEGKVNELRMARGK